MSLRLAALELEHRHPRFQAQSHLTARVELSTEDLLAAIGPMDLAALNMAGVATRMSSCPNFRGVTEHVKPSPLWRWLPVWAMRQRGNPSPRSKDGARKSEAWPIQRGR